MVGPKVLTWKRSNRDTEEKGSTTILKRCRKKKEEKASSSLRRTTEKSSPFKEAKGPSGRPERRGLQAARTKTHSGDCEIEEREALINERDQPVLFEQGKGRKSAARKNRSTLRLGRRKAACD